MDKIRLNKLIADSGYCSRRQADIYIEQGCVTVNNIDCLQQGAMVSPTDHIEVDGESIVRKTKRVYIALNKPSGVTCTTDRKDKTNIIDFVGHKERIFPIGRLDKLSQGLIFLTNDGDIVNKILRGGNAHQKEYIVTVDRTVTDEFLHRMGSGVRLDQHTKTLPCFIIRGSAAEQFRITLTQGLNRQIRRMCEALNYNVHKLQRVRIMNITLKGLPEGQWRYLTDTEIRDINSMVEGSVGTQEASVVERHKKPSAHPKAASTQGGRKPKASLKKPVSSKGSYSQYRKKAKH